MTKTKAGKSRKARRGDIAWARGSDERRRKHRVLMGDYESKEQKKKSLDKHIVKVVKKRETRDALRKGVAKELGVNWRRVVLTTKVEKGKKIAYRIKK